MDAVRMAQNIEEELALARPFGSHDYIWQRVFLHYRYRLERLQEWSASATALLSALDGADDDVHRRILGDPAVRMVINDSLRQTKTAGQPPGTELDAILTAAVANLRGDLKIPPLAEREQDLLLPQGAPGPWVWSGTRSGHDVSGDYFRRAVQRKLGAMDMGLTLATPDDHTRDTLAEGVRLLRVLCPTLAESALSHVHLIAVLDAAPSMGFTSLTHNGVPGVIFLSPGVLKNPWLAAEYLLHEAMHDKFIDLLQTHSILRPGYTDETSPMIRPWWNRAHPGKPGDWPVERALTVAHVYSCLALFFTRVIDHSENLVRRYGPIQGPDPVKQARRAFDRARYLVLQLRRHPDQLGSAGRTFLRWLGEINAAFDPSPSAEGAHIHLVLDLYEREAAEICRRIAQRSEDAASDDALWAGELGMAVRREIGDALAVLRMCDVDSPEAHALRKQSEALAAGAALQDCVDSFMETRRLISHALNSVPPAVYMSPSPRESERAPAEVVQTMVDESGRRLRKLFATRSKERVTSG
ncbi:HEXXH motif-containing putative peptide modification protein [Spongiactinospora sp. TRM90649]|uniref:aKG-HExxH-type peptide beta-hydroxylase n=1 Tax=Spongiactinospora sp. TRM90649 TaxID=3031114 RepID=UPI0023F7FEB5|nr:HEXXH motif-containing putative peptide modification protein [Spongiactinospora sp. TRM90649]MDF5758449.1 HEXXH motif-containing putative peptide modification protein [Spongiactinospora sp. TRM90649]